MFAGQRVIGCNASKLTFAAQMHLSALNACHFLYDSVGLCRGHPNIPGLNRPFATWMHGLEVYEDMRDDYQKVLNRAGLVLVNSAYTRDRHQALHGPLVRAEVCWLATEQDDPPDISANFDAPPSVLIVGRIAAAEGRKGHGELIDCWPDVVAAVPDAKLKIAGSGSGIDELRIKLRGSGLDQSVELLGFIAEEQMSALFAKAHVYAMPSRQEGFGIAYIEAMRFGLPVIASVHDAGQEVNVNGKTGYNVDLSDRSELTGRLIELLRNPEQSRVMGQHGFQRWQTNFRYSCFAERFIGIWQNFVVGADPHPRTNSV